jgi:hypothetical protein
MTVSLWIRETSNGKRRFVKPNKKKIYPEGTVFCLRFAIDGKRRWETLHVQTLTAALAARATKEAALLSQVPQIALAQSQRIKVYDAIAKYLSTVAATRAHKTWLAYNLILNEFRKSSTKEYLNKIEKADLTAFVVAQKKDGQDDRTVANRVRFASSCFHNSLTRLSHSAFRLRVLPSCCGATQLNSILLTLKLPSIAGNNGNESCTCRGDWPDRSARSATKLVIYQNSLAAAA